MTEREVAYLQKQIEGSCRYLEFGAGNSTEMAVAAPGIESIDTVESSRGFLDQCVLSVPPVGHAHEVGRLRIHHVDLGPTEDWGRPTNPWLRHRWPEYSSLVFCQPCDWDLVLIDGRFRIACCMKALLKCSLETNILIHDFWIRPRYFEILPFVEVIEKVDTFGHFRRRPDASARRIEAMYRKYQALDADWEKNDPVHRQVKRYVKNLIPKKALAAVKASV